MTLEQQIATLAELGLHLNDGITIDDLLYSLPREEYEQRLFTTLLFTYGVEVERQPWGRFFSSQVWNFDTECIYGTGSYVKIVQSLCRTSGQSEQLTEIADFVDLELNTSWLEYTVDGQKRHWSVEVNDDWADTLTLSYVMDDLERDDQRFYFIDNGQAMLLFYLNASTATTLNQMTNNALQPMLPK
jgi:hypothetical protein